MAESRRRRRGRPEPRPPSLVVELYEHLLDASETFQEVAVDLAYLWPEMLRGGRIDLARNGPTFRFLSEHVRENHPVWTHVTVLED